MQESLSKLHFEIGLRLGDAAHMAKARALSGFPTDSQAQRVGSSLAGSRRR